jgi:periplasmic protein TonB
MLHWLVLRRTLTLGVSCALNVGMIVGLLFAFTHRTPVLPVELVMLEEAPAPEPPRQKTLLQKLTLPRLLRAPKPIETPLPQTAKTVPEPPPPAPTISPAPPAGELPSAQPAAPALTESAPAVRFAGPPSGAPPAAAASGRDVASASAVTQYARPQGGYQVRPSYPASARRLGVQGTTLLKVHVLIDGAVGEVVVQESAGHVDLDQAAADAVRRWRFDPARRGNEPVAMWVLLPVEFRLR